jgi:hypothetical protein
MSENYIYVASLVLLVVALALLVVRRRRLRKIKPAKYSTKWQELQKLCSNKDTWAEAILEADKLLGRALKKRNYRGKSFGEKLVSAQRDITDNDGVWYGHKLAKKIKEDKNTKLRKNDVQDALLGIRRALKDLGALK